MQWYYSKDGAQLGPVSEGELKAKLASSEISGSDLVWNENMPDWIPAAQVSELSLSKPASVPGPPPVGGQTPSPYTAPAAAPSSVGSGAAIPNYLWQSILVTVLCCMPFGIAAIVNAAKVDGMVARGDIAGATAASASAKKWCMFSVIGWIVVVVIYAIIMALGYNAGTIQ